MGMKSIRGPEQRTSFHIVTAGDYVVQNDSVILINKSVGSATQVTLPPSQTLARLGKPTPAIRTVTIIDMKGDAGSHNITIVPFGGGDTILGLSSLVLSSAYETVELADCGNGNWVEV